MSGKDNTAMNVFIGLCLFFIVLPLATCTACSLGTIGCTACAAESAPQGATRAPRRRSILVCSGRCPAGPERIQCMRDCRAGN